MNRSIHNEEVGAVIEITNPILQLTPRTVHIRLWEQPIFFALESVFFLVFCLLQLVLLVTLPYTTSEIEYVSNTQALNPPTPNFSIGSLDWSIHSYANDPRLGVFRSYFLEHCTISSGLVSAKCMVSVLAHDLTYGDTKTDFLSLRYDPAANFSSELAGNTGFCTNFSTFLVVSLVSVGIPARVIQFIPNTLEGNGGHTLVEVWEQSHGWVLVDPSYGVQPTCDGQACSALRLAQSPQSVGWVPIDRPDGGPDPADRYNPIKLFYKNMNVVYPEPWSYLRTGEHQANFPFVTRFSFVGEPWLQFGLAQILLRWGMLISVLLALFCLVLAVRVRKNLYPKDSSKNNLSSCAIYTCAVEWCSYTAARCDAVSG